MPWKVKATAWSSEGPKYKTVAESDEFDEDFMRTIGYWARHAESGERVVIERTAD